MVLFDITNQLLDLKGDALIESATKLIDSATKFLEEADRKKQQEIEEQEQERPKTPVASKKKAVPPRWPTPKPDSIHSGLPDEETDSEFRSDTTASSVQAGKTYEMPGEEDHNDFFRVSGEEDYMLEQADQGLQALGLVKGDSTGVPIDGARTGGVAGADLEVVEDAANGDALTEAHVRVMWGAEGATRAQRLRSWRKRDEPYARKAHKKALEEERDEIRKRWARAMADGARYRAQEAERQAAAVARAAEAAERRQVQLVADAEARWAKLAAEEASATNTNHTAEHADNTDDVEAAGDEAVNDDEENDGDNPFFRGIIYFNNGPRLI